MSLQQFLLERTLARLLETFNPKEWREFDFFFLYHCWIKYQSHENKGDDLQVKKLLIVGQIIIVSFVENAWQEECA